MTLASSTAVPRTITRAICQRAPRLLHYFWFFHLEEDNVINRTIPKEVNKMQSAVKLGTHHELRLPERVARRLRLRKGTKLDVVVSGKVVVLVPVGRFPKDQRYFWTEDWQAGMREAEEDVAASRVHGPFATAAEATAALRGKCS